ncbi:Beta-N-acetylhexosaminidase [Aphelenchoides besseyi]|nr:Beta-N-acetylhexosaminidase [Aphelenchoides besseyi]KAI6201353.1 Beta-N-acetylhexosaminidase [Aphelenchoides besseyi]
MNRHLSATVDLFKLHSLQMIRVCRRYFRCNNRTFVSTIAYMVLFIFVFSLVTSQFWVGRQSEPLIHAQNVPQQDLNFDSGNDRRIKIHRNNPEVVQPLPQENSAIDGRRRNHVRNQVLINKQNDVYPLFAANNKFVPSRRIVHLDLKGGAYRPSFFPQLFDLFVRMNFTGVMIEWEDMFPYSGRLSNALNGAAYTMENVREILQEAVDRNLEIIPLVQTFGHLEWILKLEQFSHMREDPNYPQVICFGANSSFELIRDMIDQVASVHKEFGMRNFHMGADEAFQIGICNATVEQMRKQGSRERAILWHLSRVSKYIKQKYQVTVLAWHDMFAHTMEEDLKAYELTTLLQPVVWSYAEDLEMYLPFATWLALKPFGHVWGGSAFKGADGPMRYFSHPIHYIRNHESWVKQFSHAYKEFERVEGLIYSGWSRYDHLAILTELMPVAIPQLAMSAETMLEARPLELNYPKTRRWLGCDPPADKMNFAMGCNFPGVKIYELINDFASRRLKARAYLDDDYEFNGWLSRVAVNYSISSPMYIEKIIPNIDMHLGPLEFIVKEFRKEMAKIYFPETIDEYVFNYMSDVIDILRERRDRAIQLRVQRHFSKRPYVTYPTNPEL